MLSIADAQRRIVESGSPRAGERVSLLAALGRFVAVDVHARDDSPPFDASAMDGWAVMASDLAGASAGSPIVLAARGEARAGQPPATLSPTTAMRIFTGAPVPSGADSVVMQEDVSVDGERVIFADAPRAGAHVRRRGEDLHEGHVALRAGSRVGAGEVGLCASQGVAQLVVHRRPRVAIVATGDELREIGEVLAPGTIRDSNSHAISAAVLACGAEPWLLPIARDDRTAIARELAAALEHSDVLVTSGGVSVGDHDLVHAALEDAGVAREFWKVRMKPGKPLAFGRSARGAPALGLPGNPVSALVAFELFARPLLRAMLGDPAPYRPTASVVLGADVRHRPGRVELVRARLADADDGSLVATPLSRQGSGSLPSMVGVDALVVVPAERDDVAAGERLTAWMIRDERGSSRPLDA